MHVLMVCLGNICRSPLAEGILRDKIKHLNLDAHVDSAGTGNYHAGEPADPRSIEVAKKNHININSHTARQFQAEDFDKYDLIYAMDSSNYNNIIKLARTDEDRSKVMLLMDELMPGEKIDVPDPYFGGRHGFDRVYEMIDRACDKVTDRLTQQ
jgi:protein-tyrosine phosphatase